VAPVALLRSWRRWRRWPASRRRISPRLTRLVQGVTEAGVADRDDPGRGWTSARLQDPGGARRGGGWGDPGSTSTAPSPCRRGRVECIEIEDQLLPRRVEHHVGIDRLVRSARADRIRERSPPAPTPTWSRWRSMRSGSRAWTTRSAGRGYEESRRRCCSSGDGSLRDALHRPTVARPLMTFAPPALLDLPDRKPRWQMGYRLPPPRHGLRRHREGVRQSYDSSAGRMDPFLGPGAPRGR